MATGEVPPPLSFKGGLRAKPSYENSNTAPRIAERKRHPQVMSLFAYCIQALALKKGVHKLPDLETCWIRRSYNDPTMRRAVLELLPFLPRPLLKIPIKKKSRKKLPSNRKLDAAEDVSVEPYIGTIHPQLWGVLNGLIIPSTLPPILRHLSLTLTDKHVPSLHTSRIFSTPTLSLLTHVSFSSTESRIQITDQSIIELKTLVCLTVLDLTATPITSRGVLRLIASMRAVLPSKACPWRLRVLDLRRTFVDDDILLGNKSGLSLLTLPLLCAVDLRETSVSSVACKSFQRSWGSSSPPQLGLFHPAPAGSIMESISRLTNECRSIEGDSSRRQCEHAILLLQHHPEPREHPLSQLAQGGMRKRDHDLRVNTSGVVVLTATGAILGNVLEVAAGTEGGYAQASFKQNQATVASLYSRGGGDGAKHPPLQSDLDALYYEDSQTENYCESFDGFEHDIDDEIIYDRDEDQGEGEDSIDSEEEKPRDPRELAKDQFLDDIAQGFLMYREPPDIAVLSQLDAPPSMPIQARKRPGSNDDIVSVKRRRGPVNLWQI